MVAERFRTDHEELVLDPSRFFDALAAADLASRRADRARRVHPAVLSSKATKDKATVILTGEGADELFLGYDKYAWSAKHARTAAAFQKLCPSSHAKHWCAARSAFSDPTGCCCAVWR
jgi:asparagine synthetase B (glutamine-hydrolysing)